jgi:hypothetical protein
VSNVRLTAAIPAVVAHQGGWDEILMVVGPVAVVIALLVVARRRVRRRSAGEQPLLADRSPSGPRDVGTD